MGSEHAEQPGSWASSFGPIPKPTRHTPRPQRIWHVQFSLPRGPMHELRSVCCLSHCGWPPIHPKFWRGDAPDCRAYVALLCAVQKAASTNRGGERMAWEEVGGQSRTHDLFSACRGASDAKSILIIAVETEVNCLPNFCRALTGGTQPTRAVAEMVQDHQQ